MYRNLPLPPTSLRAVIAVTHIIIMPCRQQKESHLWILELLGVIVQCIPLQSPPV